MPQADYQQFSDSLSAMIWGGATVAVALISVLGAAFKSRKPKPTETAPTPLSSFSGTQNEFMELVIQDNADLRGQIKSLADDMDEIRQELRSTKESHARFEGAVRRYLESVAVAWPGPAPMPRPNERDLGVLEHTLPRWRADPENAETKRKRENQ